MRYLIKFPLYLSIFVVFLLLNACDNSSQQSASSPSPKSETKEHSIDDGHNHSAHELHSKGGQVVESGPYHIELVTTTKDDNTKLDLYLLHEAEGRVIKDAQVTANVQPPNGEQQTVQLVYDNSKEGYTGNLNSPSTGQYNLMVQSEIGGEKINSRFSFEK